MAKFEVSQTPGRYRIVGMQAQRYALPPTSGAAFAEGLLFGLPGGAVLALPVALRSNASLSQALLVWLGATGLYGMLLGAIASALRVARPLPRRSPALLIGFGFALGPLSLLGSLLHARTHHRPLGAATYAVLSAFVVAFAWAFASRAHQSLRSPDAGQQRYGKALLGLGGALSLACLAPSWLSWMTHFGHIRLMSSGIIDGLLGMALGILGGFARYPSKLESTARTSGPLAFGVCALSFAVALQSPAISLALGRASLLWAWLS